MNFQGSQIKIFLSKERHQEDTISACKWTPTYNALVDPLPYFLWIVIGRKPSWTD